MVHESGRWEGRALDLYWQQSAVPPQGEHVTQASGVCFTDDGLIVLVAGDDHVYGLPSGHPELGETIEQTLVREVAEEACATVQQMRYLGAVEVYDPHSPSEPRRYYQTFGRGLQCCRLCRRLKPHSVCWCRRTHFWQCLVGAQHGLRMLYLQQQ